VKAGDLVMLSAYGEGRSDLYKYSSYNRSLLGKTALIGLVVRTETLTPDDDAYRFCNSENEKTRYYINWMSSDRPASRWGNRGYFSKTQAFFFRKDLKFVKNTK